MQIGALWLGEKDGKKFFTGELDLVTTKIKVGVFKNENKEEGSKQPDYRIVKLEDRKQDAASESDPFSE